jgi:two-component system, OmpR family, response regulator QseB
LTEGSYLQQYTIMRILIVEDNDRLSGLIADVLKRDGHACDVAGTLAQAGHALTIADYDALVLDLGLPDGDGIAWLKGRRRAGFDSPVLMLTARGALDDRIIGLDAGADDYLVKPAAMDEISARLRALLRRPGRRMNPVLQVNGLQFDTTSRQATFNEAPLELTRREANFLELLMRGAGSVVLRQKIETALYDFDDEISPNAIDAIASRLRRRLKAHGAGDCIHTLRGLGYLLEDAPRSREPQS